MATSYDYEYDAVVDAVIEEGQHVYDLIAADLGLNQAKISSLTFGIPTPAGRLRAIISNRAAAKGKKNLVKLLLDACAKLEIKAAVVEHLEGSKQADKGMPCSHLFSELRLCLR